MSRSLTRQPDDKPGHKVPKVTVNYRRGSKEAGYCRTCSMFLPERNRAGTCTHVAGLIYPEDTCDDWEAKK